MESQDAEGAVAMILNISFSFYKGVCVGIPSW